jgi:hypothetical protein
MKIINGEHYDDEFIFEDHKSYEQQIRDEEERRKKLRAIHRREIEI